MPWVKLDDQFFDNEKIVNISAPAKLLYLAGLTYAAQRLTDGILTTAQVRIAAAKVDVDPVTAGELVTAGLWDATDQGYEIHDYLDYNPSADQVREQRRQNAVRQGRFRDRSRSNAVTDRVINTPSRTPYPLPENPEPENDPGTARVRAREAELREEISAAVYGTAYGALPPNERGEVEFAAEDLAPVEGSTREEVERRVRHVGVMWPNLAAPSASLIARRWAQIGADLAKRNGTSDATHLDRRAEAAARRREAFAAAGLVGDAGEGASGRSGHADGSDDLSGVPESRPSARGLRDVRGAGDGLPDVPGRAGHRPAPARGPDPDPVPAMRLHGGAPRQRQGGDDNRGQAHAGAGPAARAGPDPPLPRGADPRGEVDPV